MSLLVEWMSFNEAMTNILKSLSVNLSKKVHCFFILATFLDRKNNRRYNSYMNNWQKNISANVNIPSPLSINVIFWWFISLCTGRFCMQKLTRLLQMYFQWMETIVVCDFGELDQSRMLFMINELNVMHLLWLLLLALDCISFRIAWPSDGAIFWQCELSNCEMSYGKAIKQYSQRISRLKLRMIRN